VGQPRRRADRAIELVREKLPGNSAKIRLLLDLIEEQPASVLDVGCGDLGLWEAVRARPRIVGVDVALPPPRVSDIERRKASALALPVEDEEVDAVVSTQMLDDLRDRLLALREMARVVRPRGALFLTCDSANAPRSWRAQLRGRPRGPTEEQLRAEVSAAGFAIEKLRRYGRRDLKRVQGALTGAERLATLEHEERESIDDPDAWGLLYVRARKPS
jgi:SAM-dependent methyltransferase